MLVIQNETTEFVKEKFSSFCKKMSWNLHQYFGLNSLHPADRARR